MTTEKIRKRFTAAELQELVEKAQAYDQEAIDALCAVFAPLICKECAVSYVQSALGADAQNIAWEIFLDFIYHYDGADYKRLPGLIKLRIRSGLLKKLQRQEPLHATIDNDELEQQEDTSLNYAVSYEVQDALNHLTAKQRAVIEAVYFQGYTLKEYAALQDISFQGISLLKTKALNNLKKIMQNK